MLPVLVCLYGLAGFLCLLGYLYALFEWYVRQRPLEWVERLSIMDNTNESDKIPTSELSHLNNVEPLPGRLEPSTGHLNSLQRLEEGNSCENMNPDQVAPELEMTLTNQQVSWEQRRVERRQRYKAEKSRIHQYNAKEPDEHEMSQMQQVEDVDVNKADEWTSIEPVETDTSVDSTEIQQLMEDDTLQMRTYVIPEEVRLAHSMCSRRASVQVTDLDDQLRTAYNHIKEHEYEMSEFAPA